MRHKRTGRRLGRDAAHRDALKMNLAAALIKHGRITTTLIKAKELRDAWEALAQFDDFMSDVEKRGGSFGTCAWWRASTTN